MRAAQKGGLHLVGDDVEAAANDLQGHRIEVRAHWMRSPDSTGLFTAGPRGEGDVQQTAVTDGAPVARIDHGRGVRLLHDRGSFNHGVRCEAGPVEDRRVDAVGMLGKDRAAGFPRAAPAGSFRPVRPVRGRARRRREIAVNDPEVDRLDRVVALRVRIDPLVRVVESPGDLGRRRLVGGVGHVDLQLIALSDIAHVGGIPGGDPVAGDALRLHRGESLRIEHGQDIAHVPDVDIRGPGHERAHVLVFHRSDQQAERRQHARTLGNDHGRDADVRSQGTAVHGAGAAERDQREPARIVTAFHRGEADLIRHVGVDHAMNAERGLAHRHAQAIGKPAHHPVGRVHVEGELPSREASGIQVAQDDAGVGHGGIGAAAGIAGGARVRSGALGTDPQSAGRVDPRDAAAAGADGADVDHRHPKRPRPHLGFGGGQRAPVANQRDVAAGPAHVERDDVP